MHAAYSSEVVAADCTEQHSEGDHGDQQPHVITQHVEDVSLNGVCTPRLCVTPHCMQGHGYGHAINILY